MYSQIRLIKHSATLPVPNEYVSTKEKTYLLSNYWAKQPHSYFVRDFSELFKQYQSPEKSSKFPLLDNMYSLLLDETDRVKFTSEGHGELEKLVKMTAKVVKEQQLLFIREHKDKPISHIGDQFAG